MKDTPPPSSQKKSAYKKLVLHDCRAGNRLTFRLNSSVKPAFLIPYDRLFNTAKICKVNFDYLPLRHEGHDKKHEHVK